jgi:MFS family permease
MKFLDYNKISFSANAVYLYLNRLLIQIGVGLYGIFGVIFFFEKFGNSIERVLILYTVLYFIFAIGAHLGAKIIYRVGMKKMMMVSIFFLFTTIFSLLFWNKEPFLFLITFSISLALYKSFYWVPYHVEFAEFTNRDTRGRQMAVFSNISEMALAILPIIGGFIISSRGYESVFLISSIIVFISILPLFFLKETKEKYTWNARRLIKEFFQKENRGVVWSNLGNGIQDAVGTLIWPMFIFIILKGNYFSVGVITSLTIVILIVLRFAIGNALDKMGKKKILKLGSVFYTTGWIIKIFVETGTGIFLSHTYHNFGKVVNKLSFDSEIYEQAADNGHYIDEYTVLKEISLILGKGIMFLISIPIVIYLGITTTFLVAALATLLMTLASHKVHVD